MTRQLYVLGAGGHSKVILALAQAARVEIVGIYDDQVPKGTNILGYPVLGCIRDLPDLETTNAVIAIGSNHARMKVAQQFHRVQWASLVHPAAWVAPEVQIGQGSVVMAGAVIQPGVKIGAHIIVNTSTSVDHDCQIGDYVHTAPGVHLAGNVTLAEGVFCGVGVVCIPGIQVGQWSIIGAGAVVTKNIPDNVTAVGAPAKVIKEREEGWQER